MAQADRPSATACCGRSTTRACTSPTPSARRCRRWPARTRAVTPRIVGTNVVELGEELVVPEPNQLLAWVLLPAPLWILVGIGAWRSRRSWAARLVLAAGRAAGRHRPRLLRAAPLPRGRPPRSPRCSWARRVASLRRRWRGPVVAVALVLCTLSSVAGFRSEGAGWWHPSEGPDQREAGEWIGGEHRPRRPDHDPQHGRRVLRRAAGDGDPLRRDGRDHRLRPLLRRPLHRRRLVHGRAAPPQLEPLRDAGVERAGPAAGVEGARRGAHDADLRRRAPPPDGRPMGPPLGFVGDG